MLYCHMTYRAPISLVLIALACHGQLPTGSVTEQNPCAKHEPQISSIQRGINESKSTQTLSNGVRISGEFGRPTRYDLTLLNRQIGEPTSIETLFNGSLNTYDFKDGCVAKVRLDSDGVAQSAWLLVQLPHPAPEPKVTSSKEGELRQPVSITSLAPEPRRVTAVTPVRSPKVRSSGHAKAIIITTLVLGGIGVGGYYGYKSGLFAGSGGGACNVPSDRASDGSRCGGRAASVRPGGRP
jgi:hypothetical protein